MENKILLCNNISGTFFWTEDWEEIQDAPKQVQLLLLEIVNYQDT